MAARIGDSLDYLARALFPRPNVDHAVEIEYKANGKPKVYTRRWFVLTAYCMCYFGSNFSSVRFTPLISEYALYFNTTNDLKSFDELGVDFFAIFGSLTLLVFYPLSGQLVDTYGNGVMSLGSVGMAIAAWIWYLSFNNYNLVLVSIVLNKFSGALTNSCLLRVSHNWFPVTERAMAVALGAFSSIIGAAAVLLTAPSFRTGEPVINSALKSCDINFLQEFNQTEGLLCSDEAQEEFCCAAPADIDGFNLFIAFMMTIISVFTVAVTRDAPLTPPSKAGMGRKAPKITQALGTMFSNSNYMQICLVDFLCSGPPLLVFATIDRIFPPTVDELATFVIGVVLVVSIPTTIFFTVKLGKSKKFYEYTAAGYVTGCICFILATTFFLIDTKATDYLILIIGCSAFLCFIVWSVAVYELKMEYVFSGEFAIQGYVVAVDRTVLNLSTIVFLAAIPPERYESDNISGRQFTFIVGCSSFIIGTILAVKLPYKRRYRRMAYEAAEKVSVDGLEDEDVDYPVEQEKLEDKKQGAQIAAVVAVEEEI